MGLELATAGAFFFDKADFPNPAPSFANERLSSLPPRGGGIEGEGGRDDDLLGAELANDGPFFFDTDDFPSPASSFANERFSYLPPRGGGTEGQGNT